MAKTYSFSKEKLKALSQLLCQNSDHVLEKLELSLRKDSRKYSGCCPIHSGDNTTALNLYHSGNSTQIGNWVCNTRHCEKKYMSTMLGFVRGVLCQKEGKNLNLSQVIDWSLNILNKTEEDIKIDDYNEKKQNFINMMSQLDKNKIIEPKNQWTKEEFLSRIDLTDSYFINRGFSSQILTKHFVGKSLTSNPNMPSYNRIVIPFFDENKKFVIGAQGRSMFEECRLCKEYHNPDKDCHLFSKWANIPTGFEISRNFYNIWNAKKYIEETASVYIVEGAPNVWKLEECGIFNVVALCKSRMGDSQQIKLECMGVTNVYLILDNDAAGRDGTKEIKKQIGRQFRVKLLDFPDEYNDISQIKDLNKIKEYLCIS